MIQLNWLDYCLIGLICFSSIIGLARGLIQELSSLANWVLGLWSGSVFYGVVADYLPEAIRPDEVRYLLGFFIVSGLILMLVSVLSKSAKWLVNSIGLSGPDGILGLVFGGLRGMMFIALFLLVAKSSFSGSTAWQTSQLLPYFEPIEYWIVGNYPL